MTTPERSEFSKFMRSSGKEKEATMIKIAKEATEDQKKQVAPEKSVEELIEEVKAIMYAPDVDWNMSLQDDSITYNKSWQLHSKIRKTLQTERQKREEAYKDGYKQGKFDAEVTAEYGEPEVITQPNNK